MMKRKGYVDKTADDLIKKKDASEKLLAFAGRASGLTAFLVNKSKEEILMREAKKKIPALKEKLIEHKEFYEKKTIKSDHIRNLNNEITKCEKFIEGVGEKTTLEDLKLILDWYYKTSEKYGF
jgi:phosphopantetheine adenylyltransferase